MCVCGFGHDPSHDRLQRGTSMLAMLDVGDHWRALLPSCSTAGARLEQRACPSGCWVRNRSGRPLRTPRRRSNKLSTHAQLHGHGNTGVRETPSAVHAELAAENHNIAHPRLHIYLLDAKQGIDVR